MYLLQVQTFISLLMLAEAIVVAASVPLAAALSQYLDPSLPSLRPQMLWGIAVFMVLLCNFFLLKFGLYSERRPSSLRNALARTAYAVTLAMSVLGLSLYALNVTQVSNLFLFTLALNIYLFLSLIRTLSDYIVAMRLIARFHSRRVLIVGSDRRADLIAKLLNQQRSWGHRLVGHLTPTPDAPSVVYGLPRLGSLHDFKDILAQKVVDEVFFVLPDNTQDIREHLASCEQVGVTYRIVPAMYDPTDSHKLKVDVIQEVPTLTKVMVPFNPSGYIYKRVLDYIGGIAGTSLFLFMYPAVALAIMLDSPGPVLFKQPRMGRHGRVFSMYKFRTMCVDAEERKEQLLQANEMDGCIFKLRNDPRVTRVGRFLRRTSLDEFPQFLNVLRGEMSIVGPRPHPVSEALNYTPSQRRRLSMRPGLTGLWQVSGRSELTNFAESVELDLEYIDNWRFWSDVYILFKTMRVVFRGEGAR